METSCMKKIVKSLVWPWSYFTAHGNQTVAVRGQQFPIEQTEIWKKHFRKFESTQWTVEQCWCQPLLPLGIIKCALLPSCAAKQFLSPAEAMTETNEMRHFQSQADKPITCRRNIILIREHLQRGDLRRLYNTAAIGEILSDCWKSQLGLCVTALFH